MKRYTKEELIAFINRATSKDQVRIADEFIHKLRYLTADDLEELEMELLGSYDMFDYQAYCGGCYNKDEEDYGPSNPWDAPGMKVSDFIRGVRCW